MRLFALSLVAVSLSACVPQNIQVIKPLPDEVAGQLDIKNVTVSYGELAREQIEKMDQERKVEGEKKGEPQTISYLPLSVVMSDIAKERLEQRDIDNQNFADIKIEIDNLKLVNPLATILIGDTDQISGTVTAVDSVTGEIISQCYVDVIKGSGGLLGLAIRGAGVREKLSAQFSDFAGDHLGYEKIKQ